jgi:hypothetical protein
LCRPFFFLLLDSFLESSLLLADGSEDDAVEEFELLLAAGVDTA